MVQTSATARTYDDMDVAAAGSDDEAGADMDHTDTAGIVECRVHAGDSGVEARGMDASDDFSDFERAAASELL